MKWLCRAGFVLCMCTVAIAAVGVFAIADAQERKYRISNTRFADWVYALVQFNQVGTRTVPGCREVVCSSCCGTVTCLWRFCCRQRPGFC